MFAESIDAMTTDRPYRKALTETEVRAEFIRMKGRQFDPDICDSLLASPLYPMLFNGEDSRSTKSITQIFDLPKRKRRLLHFLTTLRIVARLAARLILGA